MFKYYIHIWQVPLQQSCGDTCEIWMWFNASNRYFCKSRNIISGQKIFWPDLKSPPPWEATRNSFQYKENVLPGISITNVRLPNDNRILIMEIPILGKRVFFLDFLENIKTLILGTYRKPLVKVAPNPKNLNVSCLLLHWSLPNPLKPGVKLRMKM